jgi:XH domain
MCCVFLLVLQLQVVVEDDKKLGVRNTYGEEVYEAVKTALLELIEYNADGCYSVKEIWKAKKKRMATLKEIISTSSKLKQWKSFKN